MDTPPEEVEFVREIRTRSQTEGGVFWIRDGELGVLDPELAQKLNAINFSDLTLPDRLIDIVRGRTSKAVSWKQVRAAWTTQLRHLTDAASVEQMALRIRNVLDEQIEQPRDLVWLAQEISTRSLLPLVVAKLPPADTARVLRDQAFKLNRLMVAKSEPETFWKPIHTIFIQVNAGLAVRRELRGRASGRRPRQLDLTDPVVDLLPELGMDRAVDAVTTILTAIAGPPATATACLLYELTRRPDWAARLASELESLPLADLYSAPMRVAPTTHRFVKETLRMWTSPLLLTRFVRTDINTEQVCLKSGQRYLVSPYLINHNPEHWKEPDTFDPDRWLPDSDRGPCTGASYIPFGWSPTACIGANIGTIQLMLLCHLVCTRYRIQLSEPEAVRMILAAVPLPLNFRGIITRR
jgi:cytochrome P450